MKRNRYLLYYCLSLVFKSIEYPFLVPAQKFEFFELHQSEITDFCRFIAQAWFSAGDFGFEVQGDDLNFVAIRVDGQLVWVAVDADQPLQADAQAGLLQHLALAGFRRRFARVHRAARQAPLSVIGAPGEQDASMLVEDRGRTAKP
jgi:hypothetical protein